MNFENCLSFVFSFLLFYFVSFSDMLRQSAIENLSNHFDDKA